ncbi:glycosyltransferase family 39 protein [Actinomadura parmotrematis]|uniref:Glycosyltransferase family 39 protein n=1 Tax=Actinomadura parmotrematis TaxID=2864039 RepID=A0ABS7FMX5_9ACTN|nr:glycosyltransferase family 39 protein [Actinomadura parmotrematis]MBW8481730.1 glycosyltransferase family 39 protein [Actinomadura parmotrematis]
MTAATAEAPTTAAPARTEPRHAARAPLWTRGALAAILLLAAFLYGWGVWDQTGNSYYSAAVLSGTQSWKAFFYGALDAGSFITVDKPPLSLWVQSLTARAVGVNGWSLVGPSVVMGVASVALLYATVRRVFGRTAGLVAALVLALTPITVAIDRDNNPDTLLVLLLVAAAWALQRAVHTGRLRWLQLCALFVGLAFNTKMLQGFLVLPAFALVYLLCAPGGVLRRVGHLAGAGVILALASSWWMVIVDAVPAANRPFIGGSTDGTVWDLVIGYNGLGRIFGESAGNGGMGNGAGFGGAAGIGRLFNTTMGAQISWLLPFAAIALIAGLVRCGRSPRTDRARAALLMWGGWAAVHFLVFSLSEGTFHPYYTTALAPAVAALTGAGVAAMLTAPRRLAWTLPVAFAVTGAWAFALLRRTPDWHPWLAWTVLTVSSLAAGVLLVALLGPRARRRLAVGAAAAGLLAALTGPAAYAASTALSGATNGTNPTARVGSSSGAGMGMGMGGPGGGRGGSQPPSGDQAPANAQSGERPSGGMRGGGGGGQASSTLTSYLVKNQGNATWLVAVSSAQSASSLILQTGKPVIAMGGFSGSDPAMTVTKLKDYVETGKLKYVLIDGDRGGNSEVAAWVKANGTAVTYDGSSSGSGTLYELGS